MTQTTPPSAPTATARVRHRHEAAHPGGVVRQSLSWLWGQRALLVLAAAIAAVVSGVVGIWLGNVVEGRTDATLLGKPALADHAWVLALYLIPATLVLVFPVTFALRLPAITREAGCAPAQAVAVRALGGALVGLGAGIATTIGAGFGTVLALTVWGQPLIVGEFHTVLVLARAVLVSILFGAIGALLSELFPSQRARRVLVVIAVALGVIVEPLLRWAAVANAEVEAFVRWFPTALAEAAAGSPGLIRSMQEDAGTFLHEGLYAAILLVLVVVVLAVITLVVLQRRRGAHHIVDASTKTP